ncbi:BspA family leucine-rich repeat surface protein [Lactobacillus sp. ESL0703]|uniref:BspA family leucine-rich repeat surface protein n=1 Tax=Lactobacillus sp. ESL0703 TaxID=2983218 RepID=UPI0023F715EA|nr:BspA family leucine-rich repeat surface protein [Lactobacillus sp. ESL0703]MDF7669401.1 BspA family leucine-rich repeat surface protein [Lactobacillus sp. ESL0703]
MQFNNRKRLIKAFLKNSKKSSRNLMVGAAVIASTIGGLTTINQVHAAVPTSTQASTKKATSSVQIAKVTKKTYLYNKSGKRANKKALKNGKTVKIYGNKTIKGKAYYSLGHGKYVLASHVKIAKSAKVAKDSYLYTKNGKRADKTVLKSGKTVYTYGTKTIKGKTYYALGNGKYVLMENVILSNSNTSTQNPAETDSSKPSNTPSSSSSNSSNVTNDGSSTGTGSSISSGSSDNSKPQPPVNNGGSSSSSSSNSSSSTSSDIKKGVSGQCDLTYDPSTKALHIAAGKDGNTLSNEDTITTSVSNMKIDPNDIQTISIDSKVSFPSDASQMFEGLENVTEIKGLNKVDTSKTTDMSYMFGGDISLQSLDLSNFNTSNVTDMSSMFDMVDSDNGADYDDRTINGSLTNLDLSNFDTSNVTDMAYMFAHDTSLRNLSISSFDTKNVTNMASMFTFDHSLTSLDVSKFNTGKVRDMSYMFCGYKASKNLDLSSFDTSNVTDMDHMFVDNIHVTNIDVSHFNTSNVTDMSDMFANDQQVSNLDVSNFDTSNVTDMHQMFAFNESLTSVDVSSFNTSKVTSMASMFHDDISLRNLDVSNFNTHNVTSMVAMFHKVPGPISGIDHFDFSSINDGLNGNASNHYNMFNTVIAND